MHTPLWIKIGMALGFAYLGIFSINLVGDMIGGSGASHDGGHEDTAQIADASHSEAATDHEAAPSHTDTATAEAGHEIVADVVADGGHAVADHAEGAMDAVADSANGLVADVTAAVALVGDAVAGKKVSKKCAACHSFADGGGNKAGPNLFGVAARTKGTAEGFKFSSGMKAKGGTWTDADLDTFLTDPKAFVPGTRMALKLRKEQDRANIIAYLNTLH